MATVDVGGGDDDDEDDMDLSALERALEGVMEGRGGGGGG